MMLPPALTPCAPLGITFDPSSGLLRLFESRPVPEQGWLWLPWYMVCCISIVFRRLRPVSITLIGCFLHCGAGTGGGRQRNGG